MTKIGRTPFLLFCFLALYTLQTTASVTPRIVGGEVSSENKWPFMVALMFRDKKLNLNVEGQIFAARFMAGSPISSFPGSLAFCGSGFSVCQSVRGKVCLIERGETTFTEKIENCKKGGGIAVIVFNNEEGLFVDGVFIEGIFNGVAKTTIPAVSTSRTTGLALLNLLNKTIQFSLLNETPTNSFCGGSYIGGKWVVTAAHCVAGIAADTIVLNIGGFNLETDQTNIINASNIATHLFYDEKAISNDIAIIELESEPIGIEPILLADESLLSLAIKNSSEVTTLGRGTKSPIGIFEEISVAEAFDPLLYEVNISLVSNETCNTVLNGVNSDFSSFPENLVSSDMLCAGNLIGGTGSCKGDSGGPLVLQQSGKTYLVGITSWGFGCAQPDVYGVYSRVPFFKKNIDIVTSEQLQTTFVSTSDPAVININDGAVTKNKKDSGGSLNIYSCLFSFLLFVAFRQRRQNFCIFSISQGGRSKTR